MPRRKVGQQWRQTGCGYDTSPWSVYYMSERIDIIACRRPGCKEGT